MLPASSLNRKIFGSAIVLASAIAVLIATRKLKAKKASKYDWIMKLWASHSLKEGKLYVTVKLRFRTRCKIPCQYEVYRLDDQTASPKKVDSGKFVIPKGSAGYTLIKAHRLISGRHLIVVKQSDGPLVRSAFFDAPARFPITAAVANTPIVDGIVEQEDTLTTVMPPPDATGPTASSSSILAPRGEQADGSTAATAIQLPQGAYFSITCDTFDVVKDLADSPRENFGVVIELWQSGGTSEADTAIYPSPPNPQGPTPYQLEQDQLVHTFPNSVTAGGPANFYLTDNLMQTGNPLGIGTYYLKVYRQIDRDGNPVLTSPPVPPDPTNPNAWCVALYFQVTPETVTLPGCSPAAAAR